MAVFAEWRLILATLVLLLYVQGLCFSEEVPRYTFMKESTAAPKASFYDYIVVGGGTAGCPLAATLSANFSVLLLERGGPPFSDSNITNLANFPYTFSDSSPTSPSQRFVSDEGVVNTRARVLGGGSCLNAGFFSRASPAYVKASGWDGTLVNESYRWVERRVAFEPQVRQWQSAVRAGLVEVGVVPDNGFTLDHVRGTKVGGTIFDAGGHRHTAADLLGYANPTGLTLLLHATVERILFRTKGNSKPAAYGVIFKDALGIKHKAYLKGERDSKNEIIISAGALGSPQLLMLSGVGPAQHLKSLGIKVVLDQPMVGEGMADNPMNFVYVPSPSTVETSLVQVVGISRRGTYVEAVSGLDFSLIFGASSSADQADQVLSLVPRRGALRTMDAMKDNNQKASSMDGIILEKVIGPLSKGHLKLRSRDPDDNPRVSFNYFKEPEDLKRCVDGLKIIQGVIESKAFSSFRYPDMSIGDLLNTTQFLVTTLQSRNGSTASAFKSWEQFCKDTVVTIWHYHGGCQVDHVVDHDYKVMGLDSLRIIDGSTFLASPGTNPQATVMMLGRYMGVKITNERL